MHILLVEDERSLSRALKALLEKNHYLVDAVYDGEEALDYASVENYDAIVMDIMMPKMDGITVLRTLRNQHNETPILLLTAKSEVEDKVQGLDSGANDYLTKPFATAELLARIRAMTRKETIHASSTMIFGNVSLSTASFELSTPSGSFQLANKEYQLMQLLLRNPKQVISTEQILENIWGMESEADNNVVWVYLSYLRKKLTALHADIEIKATRNLGYSLVKKDEK